MGIEMVGFIAFGGLLLLFVAVKFFIFRD